MPLDDAAGCLAEGCFELVLEGALQAFFPARGRRRRAERAGVPTTPAGCVARAVALSLWGIVLTTMVVVTWWLLFGRS